MISRISLYSTSNPAASMVVSEPACNGDVTGQDVQKGHRWLKVDFMLEAIY